MFVTSCFIFIFFFSLTVGSRERSKLALLINASRTNVDYFIVDSDGREIAFNLRVVYTRVGVCVWLKKKKKQNIGFLSRETSISDPRRVGPRRS